MHRVVLWCVKRHCSLRVCCALHDVVLCWLFTFCRVVLCCVVVWCVVLRFGGRGRKGLKGKGDEFTRASVSQIHFEANKGDGSTRTVMSEFFDPCARNVVEGFFVRYRVAQ